jgi:hypothetical protein
MYTASPALPRNSSEMKAYLRTDTQEKSKLDEL